MARGNSQNGKPPDLGNVKSNFLGTGSAAACSAGILQAPNGPVSVRAGETAMTSAIKFAQCQ